MPETDADDPFVVHLTALGIPVSLRASGDAVRKLVPALEDAWSRCLRDDGVPAAVEIEVMLDSALPPCTTDERALAGSDLGLVLHELSPVVTVTVLAEQVGSLLLFHAGAVSHPETGAAVGLVGESGAGKTTAIDHLARTFGYLSDETLGLREDHSVVPYPKPLSIIRDDTGVKEQVSPDALHLGVPRGDARLVKLLLLERATDGPAEPVLERVPNIDALVALAPQTSSLSRLPRPLHRVVDFLDATGGLHRVRYREAETLTPVVSELMSAAS